jgi:hypothetical protein
MRRERGRALSGDGAGDRARSNLVMIESSTIRSLTEDARCLIP